MGRQLVAALEAVRVVVNDEWCELREFNFVTDVWVPKARSLWTMERGESDRWLDGWNAVDLFSAMNRLVAPAAG
jgi:hypothetical protein